MGTTMIVKDDDILKMLYKFRKKFWLDMIRPDKQPVAIRVERVRATDPDTEEKFWYYDLARVKQLLLKGYKPGKVKKVETKKPETKE